MTRFCLLLLASVCAFAQPGIGQNGVVNAASQIPPTLPGGALAPGARFSIQGVRLGSSEATTSITAGGLHIKANNITPTFIDATLPANMKPGTVPLIVTVDGVKSKPFPITVDASNPGIYSRNSLGWGPGLITNLEPSGSPARPGQRIRIATTGLGNATRVTVVIGNQSVIITRLTRSDELTFTLPTTVPEGCHVPLYIQASPARASNVVTVSIARAGNTCDPGPLNTLSATNVGVVVLARSQVLGRNATVDAVGDEATVVFTAGNHRSASPLLLLPPPGTCTAYTSSQQATTALPDSISSALIAELEGRGLDAGPQLKLTRSGAERRLVRDRASPGYYRSKLGASEGQRVRPLFLEPGNIELIGPGGDQVGPFQTTIPSPAKFEWTNRMESAVVDRAKPFTVRWRGMSDDRLAVILATNTGQLSTAIGTCLCTVRASAGRFTIPPALLANIPQSVEMPGIPYDQLFLISLPANTPSAFTAKGISTGAVLNIYSVGRVVQYK